MRDSEILQLIDKDIVVDDLIIDSDSSDIKHTEHVDDSLDISKANESNEIDDVDMLGVKNEMFDIENNEQEYFDGDADCIDDCITETQKTNIDIKNKTTDEDFCKKESICSCSNNNEQEVQNNKNISNDDEFKNINITTKTVTSVFVNNEKAFEISKHRLFEIISTLNKNVVKEIIVYITPASIDYICVKVGAKWYYLQQTDLNAVIDIKVFAVRNNIKYVEIVQGIFISDKGYIEKETIKTIIDESNCKVYKEHENDD